MNWLCVSVVWEPLSCSLPLILRGLYDLYFLQPHPLPLKDVAAFLTRHLEGNLLCDFSESLLFGLALASISALLAGVAALTLSHSPTLARFLGGD